MIPLRPGPHSAAVTSQSTPAPTDPVHAAVADRDSQRVLQARKAGQRANVLDAERRSPLDVLDTMRNIDERTRSGLRTALLQSLNPSAPAGYTKPETLHGSPWGLEILLSGALKGGVTDPKGGAQSLEGKVFFSDRTPESASDTKTRKDLRANPRIYSNGNGAQTSNAASRAQQHRLTQIIENALEKGLALPLSYPPVTINIDDPQSLHADAAAWLQSFLHVSQIRKLKVKPLLNQPLEQSATALELPSALTFKYPDGSSQTLQDDALKVFYKQITRQLRETLEHGKAPYLSLLNQGAVVPMVLGFEKITHLATHTTYGAATNNAKHYSYQNHDHPLSGSAEGGKLKEIEVRSLEDLATLLLGCEVKGAHLPEDIVVRVKGAKKDKAQYLTPAQRSQFRDRLMAQAALHAPQGANVPLANQSLTDLQRINMQLRNESLHTYLA